MGDEYQDRFRGMNEKQKGAFGEAFFAALYHSADIGYTQLCKIADGGAPMQQGQRLVLPDFSIATSRFTAYSDSKCKTGSIYWRILGQWRHGIDRSKWLHYSEIAAVHRVHCFISIFELFKDAENPYTWSGAVLVQSLAKLGTPVQGMSSQEHMVYWPREAFANLGAVSPEVAQAITYRHHTSVPAELTEAVLALTETRASAPVQRQLF